MFWLKCCPRCGSDLYDERDQYGYYIACIQCGHYLTEAEDALLKYTARPRLTSEFRKVSTETFDAARVA
jgi:DNA-directed RNA polymerase subunit M/transcription elongation factor TFIIS